MPRGVRWLLESMAIIYVAATVFFLLDPDRPILLVNQAFASFGWPMEFFPTEKFWFSMAVSVPGTRAFLAFSAAQKASRARTYVNILQVSLLLTAALFAWQFVFYKRAALYALGFSIELLQVAFYALVTRGLP